MDENSPPIKCSKPGCKRFASGKFKRCDPCRVRQAGLVQKGRMKEKTTQTAIMTDATKRRIRTRERFQVCSHPMGNIFP
ncbi:hypothetical protein CPB84DRAFT_1795493 [Gymnopilus junonius]|uniref:Uncharacterized protein n=1 Tax=Gymnopilus junonius TaxID=109634 RepID=A0A9P5TG55_GYMJU|nr:hypothetical protein CPB84DRAFT_1795493 [Gymnopilus junonius]